MLPLFLLCKQRIGYIQIIIAALLWSTYSMAVKILSYPPEFVMFFRFLFGFIGLFIVALFKRDLSCFKITPEWSRLVVAGLFSGFSWMANTYSLTYTSVGNAVFLTDTYPIFVMLLSPLMLKECIEKRSILALAISLAGIALITSGSHYFTFSSFKLGELWALTSGAAYAMFLLVVKGLPEGMLGFTSNIIITAITCLMVFPFALPFIYQLNIFSIVIFILMGVLFQCGASSLYHLGLRTTKAQHVGILAYISPFSAVLWAALFLNEPLTIYSIGGGALIAIGGITVFTYREPPISNACLK